MIISVPTPALGTSKEVLANMRRWCQSPSQAVPMIDVDTADITIQRYKTRMDLSPKRHVRLALFSHVLTARPIAPEKVKRVVEEVLAANGEVWWVPYLFEYFTEPLFAPVCQRLLDICIRHWPYIHSLGPVFQNDMNCMVCAPFNGAVSPDEPARWLLGSTA